VVAGLGGWREEKAQKVPRSVLLDVGALEVIGKKIEVETGGGVGQWGGEKFLNKKTPEKSDEHIERQGGETHAKENSPCSIYRRKNVKEPKPS